jgi:probable rRNA maturation factor
MSFPSGQFPQVDQGESGIHVFVEDIEYVLPFSREKMRDWLSDIVTREHHALQEINIVLCSDEYLHRLNVEYLQHDTYTDIITFPLAQDPLTAELYISIERIVDNAHFLEIEVDVELRRVMAHGVLHLCGYGDKTESEQLLMREKENECLLLWEAIATD